MKKCPQCGSIFTDDNNFCLGDGTALLAPTGENYRSGDVPTQVIARHVPQQSRASSPWLYLLLGGALAAVICLVGFILFSNKEKETAATKNNTPTPKPTIEQANAKPATPTATAASTPEPPPINVAAIENDINTRLDKWVRDGESANADAVITNYAESVAYYRKPRATREFIRADRSRAYNRYGTIDITLSNINVFPDPTGRTSRVVLDKAYVFTGGDYLEGKVQQEIRLALINGDWLITGERDLKIYYTRK